jgi:hypothetical protein
MKARCSKEITMTNDPSETPEPRADRTDILGPEEGGTDILGPEAGGTDVLKPPLASGKGRGR